MRRTGSRVEHYISVQGKATGHDDMQPRSEDWTLCSIVDIPSKQPRELLTDDIRVHLFVRTLCEGIQLIVFLCKETEEEGMLVEGPGSWELWPSHTSIFQCLRRCVNKCDLHFDIISDSIELALLLDLLSIHWEAESPTCCVIGTSAVACVLQTAQLVLVANHGSVDAMRVTFCCVDQLT